jgi:hypothetical protein
VFDIPMVWFEGEHGLPCIYCIFSSLHYISFISTKFTYCFTYYANLYLVDYACHYVMMSRDEMCNSFMLDLAT